MLFYHFNDVLYVLLWLAFFLLFIIHSCYSYNTYLILSFAYLLLLFFSFLGCNLIAAIKKKVSHNWCYPQQVLKKKHHIQGGILFKGKVVIKNFLNPSIILCWKAPAVMAVVCVSFLQKIILWGRHSLSSHGAKRLVRELNGSCKNRWEKKESAVTVVCFLSRVYILQLKSLKMFVFGGKISHLSFSWGLTVDIPLNGGQGKSSGALGALFCTTFSSARTRSLNIVFTDVSVIWFYATVVALAVTKPQSTFNHYSGTWY